MNLNIERDGILNAKLTSEIASYLLDVEERKGVCRLEISRYLI